MTPEQTGFGATLRWARKRRGWSLRGLARQAKMSKSYIHHLETGSKRNPSAKVVVNLLLALELVRTPEGRLLQQLAGRPDIGPFGVLGIIRNAYVGEDPWNAAPRP